MDVSAKLTPPPTAKKLGFLRTPEKKVFSNYFSICISWINSDWSKTYNFERKMQNYFKSFQKHIFTFRTFWKGKGWFRSKFYVALLEPWWEKKNSAFCSPYEKKPILVADRGLTPWELVFFYRRLPLDNMSKTRILACLKHG